MDSSNIDNDQLPLEEDHASLLMSYGEQRLLGDVNTRNVILLKQVFKECANLKNNKLNTIMQSPYCPQHLELLLSRTAEIGFRALPDCVVDLGRLFRVCSVLEKFRRNRSDGLDYLVANSKKSMLELDCTLESDHLS